MDRNAELRKKNNNNIYLHDKTSWISKWCCYIETLMNVTRQCSWLDVIWLINNVRVTTLFMSAHLDMIDPPVLKALLLDKGRDAFQPTASLESIWDAVSYPGSYADRTLLRIHSKAIDYNWLNSSVCPFSLSVWQSIYLSVCPFSYPSDSLFISLPT